ncbi:MAG: DUF1552 domain-containing protein [Myxococcota bacterium]
MERKPAFFEHTPKTKVKNRGFSRRAFLGSLGAAGVVAPFLPLMQSHAAPGDFPPRLILLFSANGTLHENWAPTGTTDDFQLSPILAPLEAFKDQLIIVDGLEQLRPGPGDGHQKGMGMLWTGSQLLEGGDFQGGGNSGTVGWGGGITIDQEVAAAIGGDTAYRSLEFGVQTGGATVWSRQCYAGSNQPIAPDDNPAEVFDRLFGDLDIDTTALEKLKVERRSVIDLVKGDLDRLQGKYGAEDQLKIDAHLNAIREIEMRNDLAVPNCEVPALNLGLDHQANDEFPNVSRLQIDMMVMALACDLTRVASLQWSRAVSGTRMNWLGIPEGHHDLSHLGDGDASMVEKITAVNTYFAGEVAYLLQKLAEVPEGNGTMLDNTIVVWGNELSRGNSHGRDPIPFVIAGGGAGVLEPGRYLQYDSEPHNRLLVSIGHAMGLTDLQSFGTNDPGSGGLSGLT